MAALTTQQAMQLGIAHHQAGRLREAHALYQLVLQQEPNNPDVLHLLGVIAYQSGQHDAAEKFIRKALAINPSAAEYHNNLANAVKESGRLDDALNGYLRAIALKPDFVDAHYNLGQLYQDQGRTQDAVVCYQRALALAPRYANALNNLGNILRDQGQVDDAIACFQKAIAAQPNFAAAHYNLGIAWDIKGQPDDAIASYRAAIGIEPQFPAAHMNLGNALKDAGLLDAALAAYRNALALKPDDPGAQSNLVYTLNFHPDYDAGTILSECKRWNRQHAQPLKKFIRPHANAPLPDKRLKIACISSDFRNHVLGRNMLPLFRHHDHQHFEVFCYANVPQPDAMTEQLRSFTDQWRSIVGMDDAAVAELVRDDGIDILIDLALHMAGNRLLVMARKPAPVQVTFGGYPSGTGVEAIDFRLTDPHLDPPGITDALYAEKSIRLPDSFWCYESVGNPTVVNPLPAIANGYITFGCLNNFCKINEGVLKLWALVLRKVERSRLLLHAPPGAARQRTLDTLRQEGVNPQRVEFIGRQPWDDYLVTYRRIDVGLDTFPYNGHTTSLDSYWMGVPVVTLVGQTVVGRAGLSQLRNLGLPELVAESPDRFVKIATELAGDPNRLAELRSGLRQRMRQSPLMDAPRFARNIESAYRAMWRQWCVGQAH